jgi:glycosyltransferase involved in cell wall biosynthesis
MKPSISVIMSVFNSQAYLKSAIESILKQTFTDFEFLIIDDNSSDNSFEILKSFNDPRIKIFKRKKNCGLTSNLNFLIKKSKAPLIARMDADDIAEKDRLKKQYEFLKIHKEFSLIGTRALIIDENNNEINKIVVPSDFEEIISKIFLQNVFVHPTIMFTKESIIKVGLYDENYRKAQDYHLILKYIFNNLKVYNLKDYLLQYRIHNNSISISTKDKQEEYAIKALQWAYDNVLDLNFSDEDIKLLRHVYYWHRDIEEFKKALKVKSLVKALNKALNSKFKLKNKLLIKNDLIYDKFSGGNLLKYILKLSQ